MFSSFVETCLSYQLLQDEKQIVTRLFTLIWRVAPWAVRANFDKIFPPEEFPQNVIDHYTLDDRTCETSIGIKLKELQGRGDDDILFFVLINVYILSLSDPKIYAIELRIHYMYNLNFSI